MQTIRTALSCHRARALDPQLERRAAVALTLRQTQQGIEVLFIQRARHPQDPWSGNLGFPGGGVESDDRDSLATAIRETREEVGLLLNRQQLLGQLDDLHGSRVEIQVSCYVFVVDGAPQIRSNDKEVAHSFWYPLNNLQQGQRHGIHQVDWQGQSIDVPAIYIADELPILWGLTYRFISQFLAIVGSPLLQPGSENQPAKNG